MCFSVNFEGRSVFESMMKLLVSTLFSLPRERERKGHFFKIKANRRALRWALGVGGVLSPGPHEPRTPTVRSLLDWASPKERECLSELHSKKTGVCMQGRKIIQTTRRNFEALSTQYTFVALSHFAWNAPLHAWVNSTATHSAWMAKWFYQHRNISLLLISSDHQKTAAANRHI